MRLQDVDPKDLRLATNKDLGLMFNHSGSDNSAVSQVDLPVSQILQMHFDDQSGTATCSWSLDGRISPALFRQFIRSAAYARVSDVTLQSNAQPRIEICGKLYRLEGRAWSATEIESILEETYGAASGAAEIRGQKTLDYSYETPCLDGPKQRFRVNATGIHGSSGFDIEITLRRLPDDPPQPSEVGLESGDIRLMTPDSGLVIFAGATGSGKSTTMAALTVYHLQNSAHPVKIVDIQAPIEFTYMTTCREGCSSSMIGQSEIERHLPDFAAGVRSALRRKPHIIMVGEARDRETISASLEAALTGHLVYTTTHAGSVDECIRRLLAVFTVSERRHRAIDLATSLRFIMVQKLLPLRSGKGQTALREWMSFDSDVRETLLLIPSRKWPLRIRDCMQGRISQFGLHCDSRSFQQSARQLLTAGLITQEAAEQYAAPWHDQARDEPKW